MVGNTPDDEQSDFTSETTSSYITPPGEIGYNSPQISTTEPTGYKLYENRDYSIRIQYPNDWKTSEAGLPAHAIVMFDAPQIGAVPAFANVLLATFQIPVGSTLEEFVDFFFKDRYSNPSGYKVIGTSNTTIAGLNAKQFSLYDYDKDPMGGPGSTSKVMRILAIDNSSNGYAVKYGSDPGLFDKYLPIAQKIIDSIQINQNISEGSSPTISNISASPRQSPFLADD